MYQRYRDTLIQTPEMQSLLCSKHVRYDNVEQPVKRS